MNLYCPSPASFVVENSRGFSDYFRCLLSILDFTSFICGTIVKYSNVLYQHILLMIGHIKTQILLFH